MKTLVSKFLAVAASSMFCASIFAGTAFATPSVDVNNDALGGSIEGATLYEKFDAPQITFEAFNPASATFAAFLSGYQPAPGQTLYFAVWSDANGQDDMKWERLGALPDGKYAQVIHISDHNCDQGSYTLHAYARDDASGAMSIIAEGSTTIDIGAPEFTASVIENESRALLTVSGGLAQVAQKVVFPTWSEKGGQDDIVWYDGAKNGSSWGAIATIAHHKTSGLYATHAYAEVDGKLFFIASQSFEITAPTASVSLTGSGNGYYSVSVTNASSPSGITEVNLPSWSEANGQDDLVWHKASASGSEWSGTISAAAHMGDDGAYSTHAYVVCGNGVVEYVGAVAANMACTNFVFNTGTVGTGTRGIWVKNPTALPVKALVWSVEGGHDDLKECGASDTGNGRWVIHVNCSDFKHAGTAIAHVYAGDTMIGEISFEVAENDILPPMYRDMVSRVQGLNSASQYLVAADTNRCFAGIFKGSLGNWVPVSFFQCSPGASGSPSRTGIFTIGSKGYAFGTSSYTCYWFSQYSGNYLFHSVLYNAGTMNLQDGRLGMRLSHGCIRLAIENAKWIYDNVPSGSRVLVY